MLWLAGCSTPGPLHTYALETPRAENVRDFAASRADSVRDVPSFLDAGENVVGFAYDPFTDHFFLRLAPGDKIKVVDRPARAVKRELTLAAEASAPGLGGAGDMTIRPRDGHVFLVAAGRAALLETTRFGKPIRTLALHDGPRAIAAVGFDMVRDLLVVLDADGRRVTLHTLGGERRGEFTLERAVCGSIGFDGEQRQLYAPLRDGAAGEEQRAGAIAVFGEDGRIVRTLPLTGRFVDVGPRSFVRVF